ncbi:MAG: leucine-rich repeat domain-containing protein [Clostridiales bacterium]|nr:leucine-rich repeat domain-containing protein [Clostridiales bacterium]
MYQFEIFYNEHIRQDCVKVTAYWGNEEKVCIPEMIGEWKVTCIGKGAFRQNRIMSKVVIPPFVTAIDEEAFQECQNLKQVEMPGSVIFIGDRAFSDCPNLSKIRIPQSVTIIGKDVFNKCAKLRLLVYEYSEAENYAIQYNIDWGRPESTRLD